MLQMDDFKYDRGSVDLANMFQEHASSLYRYKHVWRIYMYLLFVENVNVEIFFYF